MPMIDVYAPSDMFPDDADWHLAQALTQIVLAAEGFSDPAPENVQHVTGCYIHRLPAAAVHTARTTLARTVRVNILTAAGGLTSDAQKQVINAATEIIANHAIDANQTVRTFVIISEAMRGGWGIAGETFGKDNAAAFFALQLG